LTLLLLKVYEQQLTDLSNFYSLDVKYFRIYQPEVNNSPCTKLTRILMIASCLIPVQKTWHGGEKKLNISVHRTKGTKTLPSELFQRIYETFSNKNLTILRLGY